jgi:hypothetical protein
MDHFVVKSRLGDFGCGYAARTAELFPVIAFPPYIGKEIAIRQSKIQNRKSKMGCLLTVDKIQNSS